MDRDLLVCSKLTILLEIHIVELVVCISVFMLLSAHVRGHEKSLELLGLPKYNLSGSILPKYLQPIIVYPSSYLLVTILYLMVPCIVNVIPFLNCVGGNLFMSWN